MLFKHYDLDNGPFFHGTKSKLALGDLLTPKQPANYGEVGRISNNIYFTATIDAAKWGAELARGEGEEHIYLIEPTGDFENDPNVTDKKFPGNPTRSYRSKQPLKIIGELGSWERHSDEQIATMQQGLAKLKAQGTAKIYD